MKFIQFYCRYLPRARVGKEKDVLMVLENNVISSTKTQQNKNKNKNKNQKQKQKENCVCDSAVFVRLPFCDCLSTP